MPTINANGVTLFYEVEGPEDGPVLVLSNSLGSSLAMWDDVVPALTDTYRTLRYDARGHGRSGSSDTPISIDDLADDLVALLDGLKIDKAHVAGLSLGWSDGAGVGDPASGARGEPHPDRYCRAISPAGVLAQPRQRRPRRRTGRGRRYDRPALVHRSFPRAQA